MQDEVGWIFSMMTGWHYGKQYKSNKSQDKPWECDTLCGEHWEFTGRYNMQKHPYFPQKENERDYSYEHRMCLHCFVKAPIESFLEKEAKDHGR